ncbi:cyclin-dependent kinases regulatory subunit 1 isoform X1 [Nycticebus coucang]|uniref:cyclin-dependent kinases regulatory subunit 1 isoform X1 n=1 Tax=Nycticebus coucang TaxID=9470 RepID=UPI00234C2641|nr:cyclin-dependent kinases regulatory subunit 1 isoform X1 [Nycticebus coucang]
MREGWPAVVKESGNEFGVCAPVTERGWARLERHVMLPKDIAKLVPKTHLMSESEWRNLGVQQSQGWVHYMIHEPEPHILLFRRPLPKKPK